MPITAKLSRRFYEKLGDEVTNELVDWLNAVDQSYRQEFRELFQAHFGALEVRFRGLEARMEGFEREVTTRIAGFEREVTARLDARMAGQEKTLIRWMFGFWIGSWAAILATVVALRQIGWLGPR